MGCKSARISLGKKKKKHSAFLWAKADIRNFSVRVRGTQGRNCILLCLWSGGTCLFLVGSSEISCQPFLNFPLKSRTVLGEGVWTVRRLSSLILLILHFFPLVVLSPGPTCIFLSEWTYVHTVCMCLSSPTCVVTLLFNWIPWVYKKYFIYLQDQDLNCWGC